MTVLAVIGSLASAAIGAIGANQAAKAQQETAEYNAKIDERNRSIIQQQTTVEQADKRRENRRMLASIRSAYGASGFDMAGSPLDVLEDTAIEQELDVSRIGYEGNLKAMGLTESAERNRMEGRNALAAGKINAASALIGGVTSAAGTIAKAGSSLSRT